MTDTNQLPEPELGYIQTDKSNQPAFSARQMREAMKHTNKLPPLPEFLSDTNSINAFVESTDEQIRDAFRAYALQARAQVQGEPIGEVGTMPGTSGFTMACFRADEVPVGTKIYTTPQPAQATQAEVTEEQRKTVDQIMEQAQVFASAWALVGGRFDSGDALDDAHEAKEELREIVSRAILSLRQQAVQPMADEEAKELIKKSDLLDMFLHIGWYSAPRKNFDTHALALIRAVESRYAGITAPAKKEGAA